MSRGTVLVNIAWVVVLCAYPVSAQKGGGQSGGQSGLQGGQSGSVGAQAGGGGQGLAGLSYTPQQWPQLRLPDVKGPVTTFKGRTVFCYRLAKGNSSTQPLVLEPLRTLDEIRGSGFYRPCGDDGKGETDSEGQRRCQEKEGKETLHWAACSNLENSPMTMGQVLVVGIDVSSLGDTGINIDQLKILNLNLTNQAGAPINPSPIRPSFPSSATGAAAGGTQGSASVLEDTEGSGDWWVPLGMQAPAGTYPKAWHANTSYAKNDVVTDVSRTQFYKPNHAFQSGDAPQDPFPAQPRSERVLDGEVIWQEISQSDPGTGFLWKEHKAHKKDDVVCVIRTGIHDQIRGFEIASASENAEVRRDPVLIAALWPTQTPAKLVSAEDDSKNTSCTKAAESAILAASILKIPDKPHAHYYMALNSGRSGDKPADPLSVKLVQRVIYLTWPYQLPADVIPTFSVNLIYTPPLPGAPWQGNTFYPSGSVVSSTLNTGHYYTAISGGFSGAEIKQPDFPIDAPPTVQDGDLVWLDAGASAPNVSGGSGGQGGGSQGSGSVGQSSANLSASKPQQWLPKAHYMLGDVILDPYNGHYYTMVKSTGGTSGQLPTGSGGAKPATDPFSSVPPRTTSIVDGELVWVLTNERASSSIPEWHTGHHSVGDQCQIDGQVYRVAASSATSGKTGDAVPPSRKSGERVRDGDVMWLDSGPTTQEIPVRESAQTASLGQSVRIGSELYVMVGAVGGDSASTEPKIVNASGRPATIADGDLLWMSTGTQARDCGAKWVPNKSYSIGSEVADSSCRGYKVIRYVAGTSGPAPVAKSPFGVFEASTPNTEKTESRSSAQASATPPNIIHDGGLTWQSVGRLPNCTQYWKPAHQYERGEQVCAEITASAQEAWVALNSGKSSDAAAQPNFPIFLPSTVVESEIRVKNTHDEKTIWADSGTMRPIGLATTEDLTWDASKDYEVGKVVFVPSIGSGRYYTLRPNLNDPREQVMPNFPAQSSQLPVTWQDSGTTPPALVASGQPADQSVNLINLGLPQTHSLSYFNLAAGLIGSFQRSPTYGFTWAGNVNLPVGLESATGPASTNSSLAVDPSTGCTVSTTKDTATGKTPAYYCPTRTGFGAHTIDPVLALTIYFPPVDAERQWSPKRVKDWIPGFSTALSLANPTTNFYVGGSNELLVRNVQLFYGAAFQKIATGLSAPSNQPIFGGAGAAPAVSTTQGFKRGFFVGVTYNLSGFVQSLGFGSSASKSQ